MRFVTFVWLNSFLIGCVLIFFSFNEHGLNLVCTNTDTQRSSFWDGKMMDGEGSVDTFATTINVKGTSSLELFYPSKDPKEIITFNVFDARENLLLGQGISDAKLVSLKLSRESDNWWGQLIEIQKGNVSKSDVITKVFYCR